MPGMTGCQPRALATPLPPGRAVLPLAGVVLLLDVCSLTDVCRSSFFSTRPYLLVVLLCLQVGVLLAVGCSQRVRGRVLGVLRGRWVLVAVVVLLAVGAVVGRSGSWRGRGRRAPRRPLRR